LEILVICIVAFLASLLTFYSGFGLGTLLLPVFSLFYGVQTAVFLTALVHFLNNSFKAVLVWKQANKQLALKFALFAIPAGLAGANLLGMLDESEGLYHYTIGEMGYVIDPINLIVGLLMVVFGILELNKKFGALQVDLKWLPLGGILSGFFGGLSGHQGALRTIFLIRAGLSREAFIATGIFIACAIDLTRIPYYMYIGNEGDLPYMTLLPAVLSAFAGAWLGNKYIGKVQISLIRKLVAVFLLLSGSLIALGII
jgi:uncharacterized membrane protein YfcA